MSQPELTFKEMTYNGVSLIEDETTGYVNITKAFKANGKQWSKYKQSMRWKDLEEAAKIRINSGEWKVEEKWHRPQKDVFYDVNTGPNEFRGTYIHPKLVHFVCEYISVDYAFKVAELMDSINDSVHQRLNDLKLPDTTQNANTVFNLIVDEQKDRLVPDNENSQCWGIREHDKFDYLDSWDKSWVKSEFEEFKKNLIDKLSLTYEELKRDYPKLVE